ncbi:hypothetical protein ACHAW5_009820 [Stephanodiscus triporus]|uniref:Uncharacterized protein n=1 Tax=Stephanodiscus triporus TaxID=2934178 RepID=A0ABD3PP26_9STRA
MMYFMSIPSLRSHKLMAVMRRNGETFLLVSVASMWSNTSKLLIVFGVPTRPLLPQQSGSDSAPTLQSPHGLLEFQKMSFGWTRLSDS